MSANTLFPNKATFAGPGVLYFSRTFWWTQFSPQQRVRNLKTIDSTPSPIIYSVYTNLMISEASFPACMPTTCLPPWVDILTLTSVYLLSSHHLSVSLSSVPVYGVWTHPQPEVGVFVHSTLEDQTSQTSFILSKLLVLTSSCSVWMQPEFRCDMEFLCQGCCRKNSFIEWQVRLSL